MRLISNSLLCLFGIWLGLHLVVAGFLLMFFTEPLQIPQRMGWAFFSVVFAFAVLALQIFGFRRNTATSRSRQLGLALSFGLFNVLLIFLVGEISFLLTTKTEYLNSALSSKRWFQKYWKPNSLGFREREFDTPEWNHTKNILILGGAFVAGQGIEETHKRFSGILRKKVPASFSIINLGMPGKNILDHHGILQKWESHLHPAILVLGFAVDDILRIPLQEKGIREPEPYSNVSRPLGNLIERSHFFNALYWVFSRPNPDSWWNLINERWQDGEILKTQLEELALLVEYANNRKIPLVALLLPLMNNIQSSRHPLKTIENFLANKKVLVMNLGKLVSSLNASERTVNKMDFNPSSQVHALIGNELYSFLVKSALIQ